MALPKKKRGFRKITVNRKGFNWNFPVDSVIDIRPSHYKNNKLIVDFGWFDTWLHINDYPKKNIDFSPRVVTPVFLRQCILFALQQGWVPEQPCGIFKIRFALNEFQVDNSPPNNKV